MDLKELKLNMATVIEEEVLFEENSLLSDNPEVNFAFISVI